MILIIAAFHKKEEAKRIGRGLLNQRLIAGYNLWPVESAYWWKGEILEESEVVMLLKSTSIRWFDDIADYIRTELEYEVPDLIAVDSEKIEPVYQKWLNEEVK